MADETEHLLVVDDDEALCGLLSRYLTQNGYRVSVVHDGGGMERLLSQQQVDLVILDLMLPGEDGLSLAARMQRSPSPPLIMISARGDDVDRIVGLEVGADDYLAKPFNPRELLARVRAVLRRGIKTAAGQDTSYSFGPFQVDTQRRQLYRDGHPVELTSGEFSLLRIFIAHPNQVLERDHMLEQLKGYERNPFDRSIDVRVTRLRRKLEPDPSHPTYIRTVWGEGYMFCPGK